MVELPVPYVHQVYGLNGSMEAGRGATRWYGARTLVGWPERITPPRAAYYASVTIGALPTRFCLQSFRADDARSVSGILHYARRWRTVVPC